MGEWEVLRVNTAGMARDRGVVSWCFDCARPLNLETHFHAPQNLVKVHGHNPQSSVGRWVVAVPGLELPK